MGVGIVCARDVLGQAGALALTFITGGASEIGFAIASDLAKNGATIVVADRNKDLGPQSVQKLRSNATFVYMDQANAKSVEEAVACTGPLAGIGSVSIAEIDETVQINLLGIAYFMRYVVAAMKDSGRGGSIVNITSICDIRSTPFHTVFSATRAGVISLIEGCARDYGPDGIRINGVAPGYTETPLLNQAIDRSWATKHIPSRRMGDPSDIAKATLFLLSDDARQITGVNLRVDGGLIARHHIPPPGFVQSAPGLVAIIESSKSSE